MRHPFSFSRRGATLLEIVVGVGIIVLSIVAIAGVYTILLRTARTGIREVQAQFLLEEGAEVVRLIRDASWVTISDLSTSAAYYPFWNGSAWTLTALLQSPVDGVFERTITVADVYRDSNSDEIVSSGGTLDPDTRAFTVSVSWIAQDATTTESLSFYLANIIE